MIMTKPLFNEGLEKFVLMAAAVWTTATITVGAVNTIGAAAVFTF